MFSREKPSHVFDEIIAKEKLGSLKFSVIVSVAVLCLKCLFLQCLAAFLRNQLMMCVSSCPTSYVKWCTCMPMDLCAPCNMTTNNKQHHLQEMLARR
jgi:hypothetical protein